MTKYTVECDGNVTTMATEDYCRLTRLADKAQSLYWRGYITAAVCVTIGWMAMTALALVGRA